MIHIATLHWGDDRFIDVQLRALGQHIPEEFRVYAFLHGLDAAYRERFFYVSEEPIRIHSIKLNLLADVIGFNADASDLLIFMDGDAWPIAPFVPWVREQLKAYPLIAVGQPEAPTQSQLHPHPCFAVTTVGFWQELRGDWSEGKTWTVTVHGKTVPRTDTGGNLMWQLEQRGVKWLPLTRSNTVDLNPILFGVYGSVVYHHGAGFHNTGYRQKITVPEILAIYNSRPGAKFIYRCSRPVQKRLLAWLGAERLVQQRSRANAELSDKVFEAVRRDPLFPFHLIDPTATADVVMRRAESLCGETPVNAPGHA